jgi:bifunctional ADP-heptose synthase (sugar kinase/adenylyltransferase)
VQKRNNIIIGDLIIDQNYFMMPAGRSAEFISKKFFLIDKNFNLGGAGMVYEAFKKLDTSVDFYSISPNKFKNLFKKLKLKNILFSNGLTVEKKRYWENNKLTLQLNNIRLNNQEINKFQSQFLKKIARIKSFSNIILCDYRYGIFSNNFSKKIIKILKKKKCEIYVDQQSTSEEPDIFKFKDVDYLILNKLEFSKVFKTYKIKGKNLLKKLSNLQKLLNIKFLVIKTGLRGCSIFVDDRIINSMSPKKTNSHLNTIGAGDYFLASFVYNRHENLLKRMKLSNNYAFSKITGKIKFIKLAK